MIPAFIDNEPVTLKQKGYDVNAILATEYGIETYENLIFTKKDSIEIWRSGRMKFDRYETSEVTIRHYGDAAVVTGRLKRTRTVAGRTANDDWRFTKVYVRRGGVWQVVAFHGSPSAQ